MKYDACSLVKIKVCIHTFNYMYGYSADASIWDPIYIGKAPRGGGSNCKNAEARKLYTGIYIILDSYIAIQNKYSNTCYSYLHTHVCVLQSDPPPRGAIPRIMQWRCVLS